MKRIALAACLALAGPARAQPADAPAEPTPSVDAAPAAAGGAGAAAVDTLVTPLEDATRLRIFQQLQRREEEVTRREADLARRQARLEVLREDVEARYKALRLVQEELSAATQARDQATPEQAEERRRAEEASRAENVKRVSKVFEKMKPVEAAKVVPEMDEQLVVDVLLRIKDRQAARILGGVEPTLAARLSEKMAKVRKARAGGRAER